MRGSFFKLALLASVLLVTPAYAGGHGHNDDDEDDFDRAQELHHAEKWDEAAAKWIASFQAGHREETSAYNASCALARAGRKDLAFQWLEKAYEIGFDLDRYLDDDRDLRSLRSDPRFAALRAKVYQGHPSQKEREGAHLVQKYNALRGQKDATAGSYDGLGRELLDAERYEEAAQAFLAAAAREEHQSTALYNAACARSRQGQNGPALDLLQRAVEQGFADPKHLDEDDDLDGIRGEPRFKQIRALAVELEVPDYPPSAHDRRGKNLRRWQDAMPRIEAAARNHPQLGQAWFNLGFGYLATGRADLAVPPFAKAAELGYRKSSSMYNVACAYAVAGHPDEAYAWLDRAVAAGFSEWWQLRQDEDLDGIRTDARFRKYLDLARQHAGDEWR